MNSLKRFVIPVLIVSFASLAAIRGAPFPFLSTAIAMCAWWYGTIAGLSAFGVSMLLSLLWIHPWYEPGEPAKHLGFITSSVLILWLNHGRAKAESLRPADHQLSEIAHRLSTVITSIIGYAELAIGEDRERLDTIATLTVQAREAIEKLYWFARDKE